MSHYNSKATHKAIALDLVVDSSDYSTFEINVGSIIQRVMKSADEKL